MGKFQFKDDLKVKSIKNSSFCKNSNSIRHEMRMEEKSHVIKGDDGEMGASPIPSRTGRYQR